MDDIDRAFLLFAVCFHVGLWVLYVLWVIATKKVPGGGVTWRWKKSHDN